MDKEVIKKVWTLSLKLVLIYLTYGLAWVFFTDKLAYILIKNPYFLTVFQTTKGFLFVAISALILCGFLLQTFTKIINSEKRIRESEKRWRSLVQNAPDIVLLTSNSGEINYINRDFDGILREDAIGKKLTKFLPSKYSKVYQKNFREVIEKGKIKSFEIEIESKSKQGAWLELKMAPVEEGAGNEVISFARDITDRKNAEKALRESEDRFQKIYNQSNDAIVLVDPHEEKIVDANSKAFELFEYSKKELLEKPFSILHPNDTNKCREFTQKVSSNPNDTSLEIICNSKSGNKLFVEISASSIDVDGQIYVIFLIRDVSMRKKVEQEITLLAHAIKSISECVVITDMENKILFVNDAFQKTYGYEEKELIGKSVDMIRSDVNPSEILAEILPRTIKDGGWSGELFNRRKDGTDFPIFLSTSVMFDEKGKSIALVGVSKDISERKEAEKALRQSEEKYRTLFEESNDVVFISTPDGRILDINSAGVDLFGYSSKEELLRIKVDKDLYWNPEDREKYKEILVRQGFVKDFELIIKRGDGQKLIVLETARPVYDKDGKVIKYRGILRDITDKKRLEEQLRQAQKLQSLGTLAGGIAHDFNNILGIILGYATMLENNNGDSNKLKWNLNAIVKAVNRGSALVQQILTFARKTDVLFETVKVNAAINELVKLATGTFPKTISFRPQLQDDLPYIKADHNQIHQALLNLLVNGRDAMPKGGTLFIKTSTISGDELSKKFPDANDQNYVSIIISDEGTGMNKETLNRVFEPFFTTKKRGKGTGLGLAVVYGVVSSHHGFIDVESELNVGTTFYLYFPVAEELIISSHGSNGDQKAAKGGSETILFVEDEEMLRELIENLLKDNGYKVLTAEDGEKAVEMYSKNIDDIDLVITDMGLPKLNGWKAYLKMREYNPELKMILASGYLDPEIRAELTENAQEYFIQKPYDLDDMLKKVREVIEFSRN